MPERMNWRRKKPVSASRGKQPVWQLIANLGDNSPFDYGGYFVYKDETGVYPEEAEFLVVDNEDDEDSTYTIYRILLDVAPDEWFLEDLESIADHVGSTKEELVKALSSRDPLDRAYAYKAVAEYHGWDEFDSYPLTGVTRQEVEARYSEDLERLRRRNR